VAIDGSTEPELAAGITRAWVEDRVPESWRAAGDRGGPRAVREVRTRSDYHAWYPVFAASGLVMPTWAPEHGGLGATIESARAIAGVLAPYNLRPLNQLGLNNAAAALFAHGTEEQRRRFLPPIVRNEEVWCQLFSEPGAGSDLASLATRAIPDGKGWRVTGQKVWTTWAGDADWAILLARTNPDVAKHQGITYFLIHLRQPGVEIRPLRHLTGEIEFNEVFLDDAWVDDAHRIGPVDGGWRIAGSTLSSERQMVAGAGSGGIGRVGGSGTARLIQRARELGRWDEPAVRDRLMVLWCEERVREWTNARVRATAAAGQSPGAAASIGKVHQGSLNQRLQLAATDLLGAAAVAWDPGAATEPGAAGYAASLPYEVEGMLRSRANTIEGGTSEVNKNILGERVLGLPREPDTWHGRPWSEVPRS
jgi:alkylation response protein AidB-like acyl-CoA dehydrogenase